MVRTQIQITEAQYEALRSRAAAEGRSMADLIRESVDATLKAFPRKDAATRRKKALGLIGRYRSGPADLATRHDAYLAKAFR